jgi:hypothetical protein
MGNLIKAGERRGARPFELRVVKPKDGKPCDHPGCLSHVSHPCEGCGRIAGISPRERELATAGKEIVEVVKRHGLTEGEMWSALGQAGTFCVTERIATCRTC